MSSKADAPTDGSNAGISDFLKKFDPTLSPADYIKRFFLSNSWYLFSSSNPYFIFSVILDGATLPIPVNLE